MTTLLLFLPTAFGTEYDNAYSKVEGSMKKVPKMLLPVPLSGKTKSSLMEYDPEHIKKATERDIRVMFDRSGSQRPYFYSVYAITNPANPEQVRDH